MRIPRGQALTSTDPSNQLETAVSADQPSAASSADAAATVLRQCILIGSQRDPAAYRARPKRDWTPIDEGGQRKAKKKKGEGRRRKGERGMGGSPPIHANGNCH